MDIQNAERTGSHPASVNGLYVTGDFGADNNGVEFRHSNATQGIGIGYNTIYAAGSHADQDLNIKPKGSGQVAVKGNLDVDGTVNGERRRDRFQVGDPDEQTQWLDRVVDIKEICGDEDGCRIKLLMQHELNDTVRTITEEIYIEQTKISKNRLPGLYGHTRQSGGGEYNDWRLGVGADNRYTLFSPYNWIYGLNYRHKYVIKGSHGPAFTGEETYKIAIMVHPHVTATVIIYDR